MNRQTISIATSLLTLLLALLLGSPAMASVTAGKVTNLNGTLFAERLDGTMLALAKDSTVAVGDTLVTAKRSFARIVFIDSSEVILRPETRFKIEALNFDPEQPEADHLVLDTLKGGLRAITGQVGKRGNSDAYRVKTTAATIGIRGTVYEVRVCNGNCGDMPDGAYFFCIQGMIEVSNRAGSVTVGPGEYAYARDQDTLPVLIPEPSDIDFDLPSDWSMLGGLEDWARNPGAQSRCEMR